MHNTVSQGAETTTITRGVVPVMCVNRQNYTQRVADAVNFIRNFVVRVQLAVDIEAPRDEGESPYCYQNTLHDQVAHLLEVVSLEHEKFRLEVNREINMLLTSEPLVFMIYRN